MADGAHGAIEGRGPQDIPEAAAQVDGTPAPEEVLPMDTMTAVMDEMVPGDGSPAPEVVLEVNTSTAGGADAATSASVAAADGPISSSSLVASAPSSLPWVAVNDNTAEEPMEEPEVILGHHPIEAPRDVSPSDALGTANFALN
jgi:hypothetical protein